MTEDTYTLIEQEVLQRIEETLTETMEGFKQKYSFITEQEMLLIEQMINNSLKLLTYRLTTIGTEQRHKEKQLEDNSIAFYQETVMLCHLTLSKMNNERLATTV